MSDPTVLIVDDDPAIRFAFKKTLQSLDARLEEATDGEEAIRMVRDVSPSVVFMDVSMPRMSGLEALEQIAEEDPTVPVVIITGYGNMQTAIRAMQLGAYDYLTKPLDIEKVRDTTQRAIDVHEARRRLGRQDQLEVPDQEHDHEIVGKSAGIQEVFKRIGVISTTPRTTNVLIQGETGTGKELVARAIHASGPAPDSPFLAINCTVLPEELLENELFGHEKGAFTGADRMKRGKFEVVEDGTILLDEIGDMPTATQKKLLRVIHERNFERLGGHDMHPVSARIIAATHRDLLLGVEAGEFRSDLYYRLNVMDIHIPPLRERREDIPLLVDRFLWKFGRRFGRAVVRVAPTVLEAMHRYPFPGNVRELENMVERATALERGDVLRDESFPPHLFGVGTPASAGVDVGDADFNTAKREVVTHFERKYIIERLRAANGNVTHAARDAGVERQSFQRLMKKHGIAAEEFRPGRGSP